jgi:hypothetical protein
MEPNSFAGDVAELTCTLEAFQAWLKHNDRVIKQGFLCGLFGSKWQWDVVSEVQTSLNLYYYLGPQTIGD